MKFKTFIFQAWRSWNLIVGSGKSWKIKAMSNRLVTADVKARIMQDVDK